MDGQSQIQDILQQIRENGCKQTRYARLQCLFSLIAALCCGALLVLVISLMPQLRQTVAQVEQVAVHAQALTGEVQGLADQAQTVLSNLETVTQELAEVDLASMVSDVDALVVSSQEGVAQALEKIEAMDIEALNKAIANMSAVVEPMAKFFKVFQ